MKKILFALVILNLVTVPFDSVMARSEPPPAMRTEPQTIVQPRATEESLSAASAPAPAASADVAAPAAAAQPAATTPINAEDRPSSDSMSTDFMFDLNPLTNEEIDTTNFTNQGLNYIFNKAVAIMAGTIGTAAVLAMVYGGFQIITAMGREDEMNAGKAMIEKAIKALVFVLGAYVIVTAVQFLIKSIYS